MAETRFMRVQRTEVVHSRQRKLSEGYIPPFSYTGGLTTSVTGMWPCKQNLEIKYAVFTALNPGSEGAGLAVMKRNILEQDSVLRTFQVPAATTQLTINMFKYSQPSLLADGDRLYIASFTDSFHENVVIRFYAEDVGVRK